MEIMGNKVPVCKYCGKEYIENKDIPANFPEFIREAMRYRPACNCEEKQEKKRREEQEI